MKQKNERIAVCDMYKKKEKNPLVHTICHHVPRVTSPRLPHTTPTRRMIEVFGETLDSSI